MASLTDFLDKTKRATTRAALIVGTIVALAAPLQAQERPGASSSDPIIVTHNPQNLSLEKAMLISIGVDAAIGGLTSLVHGKNVFKGMAQGVVGGVYNVVGKTLTSEHQYLLGQAFITLGSSVVSCAGEDVLCRIGTNIGPLYFGVEKKESGYGIEAGILPDIAFFTAKCLIEKKSHFDMLRSLRTLTPVCITDLPNSEGKFYSGILFLDEKYASTEPFSECPENSIDPENCTWYQFPPGEIEDIIGHEILHKNQNIQIRGTRGLFRPYMVGPFMIRPDDLGYGLFVEIQNLMVEDVNNKFQELEAVAYTGIR